MLYRQRCAIRRLTSTVCTLGMSGMISMGVSHRAVSQSPTSSAVPVITATFAEPDRSLDWQRYRTLYACQSALERTSRTATFDRLTQAAHMDSVHVAQASDNSSWKPLPENAHQVGQQCLRHVQVHVASLPAFELSTLLQLAIEVDADSLVDVIMTRQLALAGSSVRGQAQVLTNVIEVLTRAPAARDTGGTTAYHLSPSHAHLARRYADQLDALGPAALLYRMRATIVLNRGFRLADSTIAIQLAAAKHSLEQVQAEVSAAPEEDRPSILQGLMGLELDVKRKTYLLTLAHADLTRYVEASPLIGGNVGASPGTPAASVVGDYWFNAPGAEHAPTVPAPGRVSLIVFVNPDKGARTWGRWYGELRQLHMLFPALQIVLVAMTQGTFQGRDLRHHPDQEANVIKEYFTDSMQVPGIVCVIKSDYRMVDGGRYLPLPSPVLNSYKLDPRFYGWNVFLVDAQGWIVLRNMPNLDVRNDMRLIQGLLAQADSTHSSTTTAPPLGKP